MEATLQARSTRGPLPDHHCTSTVHRQGLQRWVSGSSKEDKANGFPKETNHRLDPIRRPIHSLSHPTEELIAEERSY